MTFRKPYLRFLVCCLFFCLCCAGCSSAPSKAKASAEAPLRDATPQVLSPESDESNILENQKISLDLSNVSQGYLLLTYSGTNAKVKFQIAAPNKVTYTYLVTDFPAGTVLPLTGGDGTYTFSLLESVNPKKDLYAIAYTATAEVELKEELLPFLAPNVYVNYTAQSTSVAQGSQLAQSCHSDLEVIEQIYHYVTETISYDQAKAQTVAYGYIPNPDKTLETEKGICFDYASLMTAMLRSQRIPTRLEVGYAGEIYHAWISCYVEEIGWIDNIIEFNGENWSLMDPTLAANNSRSAVEEYIGDGSSYLVKYTY